MCTMNINGNCEDQFEKAFAQSHHMQMQQVKI